MQNAPKLRLLALAILLAPPARAEFVVADPPDAGTPSYQNDPRGEAQSVPNASRRPSPATAPAIPLARGFGEDVPLSFAIRQIVPPGTRVTLAEGVDAEATLDWRGGRRWHQTLAQAIAPLGLRLVAVRGGWLIRPQ